MRATFSTNTAPENIPLSVIKETLSKNIGKNITITELNRNTKKVVNKYRGIIIATYNNLFSIKMQINKTEIEKCFNYSGFSVGLLQYKIED